MDNLPTEQEIPTHEVWIPALHRDLTGGVETVRVAGATVREVLTALDARYPGIYDRLCEEGRLQPYVSLAVNGVIEPRGLRTRLPESSELHFIPALGGGATRRAGRSVPSTARRQSTERDYR